MSSKQITFVDFEFLYLSKMLLKMYIQYTSLHTNILMADCVESCNIVPAWVPQFGVVVE